MNQNQDQKCCYFFLQGIISVILEYFKAVLINHTTLDLYKTDYAIIWKVT